MLSDFGAAFRDNIVREKEWNPEMKDEVAMSNAASLDGVALQRSSLYNSDARTRKAMQSAIPLSTKICMEQLQGRGLAGDANEFTNINQLCEMFSNQKSDGTV
eukprot:scaffold367194_cov20-Attheya_sp.AAC.1